MPSRKITLREITGTNAGDYRNVHPKTVYDHVHGTYDGQSKTLQDLIDEDILLNKDMLDSSNGIPILDSNSKILEKFFPDFVFDSLSFQGTVSVDGDLPTSSTDLMIGALWIASTDVTLSDQTFKDEEGSVQSVTNFDLDSGDWVVLLDNDYGGTGGLLYGKIKNTHVGKYHEKNTNLNLNFHNIDNVTEIDVDDRVKAANFQIGEITLTKQSTDLVWNNHKVYTDDDFDHTSFASESTVSTLQTHFTGHEDNISNPHGVTASQTGAYTESQVNTELGKKVDISNPSVTSHFDFNNNNLNNVGTVNAQGVIINSGSLQSDGAKLAINNPEGIKLVEDNHNANLLIEDGKLTFDGESEFNGQVTINSNNYGLISMPSSTIEDDGGQLTITNNDFVQLKAGFTTGISVSSDGTTLENRLDVNDQDIIHLNKINGNKYQQIYHGSVEPSGAREGDVWFYHD